LCGSDNDITWQYVEPAPKLEDYRRFYEFMHDFHVLEELSNVLSIFKLPEPLTLQALPSGDCAEYVPSAHAIQICPGFFKELSRLAPPPGQRSKEGYSRDEVLIGAIKAIMLHEAGHALFDMLDVPVFGREEDAADQMAVFLALETGPEGDMAKAKIIVAGIAHTLRAHSEDPSAFIEWAAFTDEHSSWENRYRNTVCLAYGGDHEAFKDFIEAAGLTKEDLDRCTEEYGQIRRAFETTIEPFFDPALLKAAKERNLAPSDAKTP
jgi:hypothetical protein